MNDEYGDGLCRAFIGAVSSRHPGGANTAFVDGSVKFIKDTIDSWAVDAEHGDPAGGYPRHVRPVPARPGNAVSRLAGAHDPSWQRGRQRKWFLTRMASGWWREAISLRASRPAASLSRPMPRGEPVES